MTEDRKFELIANNKAKLSCGYKTYENYFVITNGGDIYEIEETLSYIKGTAEPITISDNNNLVFQVTNKLLSDHIREHQTELVKNGRAQDGLKIILRDLGLIATGCKEKNMDVDFQKIFVSELSVRAVAVKSSNTDFVNWKRSLVAAMVSTAINVGELGFRKVVNKLNNANDCGAIKDVFNSHYFWNKSKRMKVISSFDNLKSCRCQLSQKLTRQQLVSDWRQTMRKHEKMKIMPVFADRELATPLEIDRLCEALREVVVHFYIKAHKEFKSNYEALDFIENEFPDIMDEVYGGVHQLIIENEFEVKFKA